MGSPPGPEKGPPARTEGPAGRKGGRGGEPAYHPTMTTTRPASLPFTGDPAADALLASDPLALLIGFVLDQQVTVQKAFAGPAELLLSLIHISEPTRLGMIS